MEILERYYLEFDGPRVPKFRKHLIPFARNFYHSLTEESFQEIKEANRHFKTQYPSTNILGNFLELLDFETKEEYLDYYEKRKVDFDNLCRETRRSDCLL